jgi:hypothetical protein
LWSGGHRLLGEAVSRPIGCGFEAVMVELAELLSSLDSRDDVVTLAEFEMG